MLGKKWTAWMMAAAVVLGAATPAAAQSAAMQMAERQLKEKRYDEARISLGAACTDNIAKACDDLGDLHENGKGGKKNSAQAENFFARACQLGRERSCFREAFHRLRREPNHAASMTLVMKACDEGLSVYCSRAGYYQEKNWGDPKLASQLYEKGCARNDAIGCHNVAASYSQGIGRPMNKDMARQLYKDNCDRRKYAKSCSAFASLSVDAADKTAYGAKACNAGRVENCLDALRAAAQRASANGSNSNFREVVRLGDLVCPSSPTAYGCMAHRSYKSSLARWDRAVSQLKSYQPYSLGCRQYAVGARGRSQASWDRHSRLHDESWNCMLSWQRSEIARLNRIISGMGDKMFITTKGAGPTDAGFNEWSIPKFCDCNDVVKAAEGKIYDRREAWIGDYNRHIRLDKSAN